MKKTLLFLLLGIAMISCGDKSHDEYPIKVGEDVRVTDRFGSLIESKFLEKVYPEDNELYQIFTVVPGTYKITSDTKTVLGGVKSSAVHLTLKLKLLKPVEILDDMLGESIGINLLDADDNLLVKEGMTGYMSIGEIKFLKDQMGLEANKQDEIELFKEFLQSAPGTETEITFGMPAHYDSYKKLEDARNIEIFMSPYLLDPRDTLKLNPKKWKFK